MEKIYISVSLFLCCSYPLTWFISFYWLLGRLHPADFLRKSAELQNPGVWAHQEQYIQMMHIQRKWICLQTKSIWCMMQRGSHEKEPLLLIRFGPRCLQPAECLTCKKSGCEWTQTTHLISCVCYNLINVYRQRHDCRLACSSHLAERFQMHSLEPEGLQLTYHETQMKMIKEASAVPSTA